MRARGNLLAFTAWALLSSLTIAALVDPPPKAGIAGNPNPQPQPIISQAGPPPAPISNENPQNPPISNAKPQDPPISNAKPQADPIANAAPGKITVADTGSKISTSQNQILSKRIANRRQNHWANVFDDDHVGDIPEDAIIGDDTSSADVSVNDADTSALNSGDSIVDSPALSHNPFSISSSDDIPSPLESLTDQEANQYIRLMKQQKTLPPGSPIDPVLAELQERKDAMLNPDMQPWLTVGDAKKYEHDCRTKLRFQAVFEKNYPTQAQEWKEMTRRMELANYEQRAKMKRFENIFGYWDAKKGVFPQDPQGADSDAANYMRKAQEQDKVLHEMYKDWYEAVNGKELKGSTEAVEKIRQASFQDEVNDAWNKDQAVKKAQRAAESKTKAAAQKAIDDQAASVQKANNDLLSQINAGSGQPAKPQSLMNILDAPTDPQIANQLSYAQQKAAQNWAQAQEGTILDQLKGLDLDDAAENPEVMAQVETLLDRASKLRDLGSGVGMDIANVLSKSKDSTVLLAALKEKFPEIAGLNPWIKQADGGWKKLFGDLEDVHL